MWVHSSIEREGGRPSPAVAGSQEEGGHGPALQGGGQLHPQGGLLPRVLQDGQGGEEEGVQRERWDRTRSRIQTDFTRRKFFRRYL